MGRVLFTSKAEPAIDWSEIESRLLEISTPARPRYLMVEKALPVEPSATLAHDPAFADELPVTTDLSMSNPGDPLDVLSLLAAIPFDQSKNLSHQSDCREAI